MYFIIEFIRWIWVIYKWNKVLNFLRFGKYSVKMLKKGLRQDQDVKD